MKEKENSELHHRLEMVQDDVKALLKHLEDGKSMKEQTKYVDDGYTHLNQPFFEDPFSGKDLTMNRELTYNKWIKYIHDYQLNKNKKMEREIAVNQIVLTTSYIRNEDGSITYDFEMMAEEFENELSKLDDSVVVMCSVEVK